MPMHDTNMRDIVRGNIRQIRKEKKLTQQKLAELVGGKGSGIAKIESGQVGVSEAKLKKIASAMNIEYLVFFEFKQDFDKERSLTDDEINIIKKIRTMADEHRATVIEIINTFVEVET